MSTLQRSTYSFRRQGSSGRIWDNRVQITDIKEKSREFNYHPIPKSNVPIVNAPPPPDPVVLRPPPRSEAKAKRCVLVSIFGCCVGSHAS